MIQVVIVNRSRLICSAFADVLKSQHDIYVAGWATEIQRALHLVRTTGCEVVLVSASLPDHGVFDLIEALASDPSVKVIVTGVRESEETILRYIEAGANGYVCGEDSVRDLAVNIRAVHHGEALVSSRMAGAMMARLTTLAQQCPAPIPEESQFAALSAREQEVLALMSEGCTNRDIAQRLVIGVGTAKNHAHRIFRKLEVNSREEAIRLWLSRDGCGGCSQVDSIGPDSSRGIRLPEESAVN